MDQELSKLDISIIVPTLNEGCNLESFIDSLKDQSNVRFETLIVDGGSNDKTVQIAQKNRLRTIILPGYGEFISRNIGAQTAESELLLFTCADVIFPKELLSKIVEKFEENPKLIAVTGLDHPFDAPFYGKLENSIYNLLRYLLASLRKPFKRFLTSTNFLVVRKKSFEEIGGFLTDDINADGLMGKKLLDLGDVQLFSDLYVYSSGRRMKRMGFFAFNRHYLYALENFFSSTSELKIIGSLKHRSRAKHGEIHKSG